MVILGAGGVGKSELARAIGERADLPVVHLDVLFYSANWEPKPRDAAVTSLATKVAGDRWILDGNSLTTADDDGRFRRANRRLAMDLELPAQRPASSAGPPWQP